MNIGRALLIQLRLMPDTNTKAVELVVKLQEFTALKKISADIRSFRGDK
ncbi:hypothetical protein [Thalassomonas haliotis]|uniref:Uncharacterized protein n=1 Tax=Thalassomonas haliotis TaxID=485448 RepID=A0ABY7VCA7_9GAMM|nr:hypothetical protein [Thalassomonas haliotis]WDE11176.1 hypothetical protein H3N35_23555 [Thalassomonas haliotis]